MMNLRMLLAAPVAVVMALSAPASAELPQGAKAVAARLFEGATPTEDNRFKLVLAERRGLPVVQMNLLLPGGYVGVDVFFVISGFLITSLLTHEHAQGRLDIPGFYARRIRRISARVSSRGPWVAP
mgnify:CR=1 FL=1